MSHDTLKQAAVLAIQKKAGKWQVLVISSRSGKRWVIPKGIVEPGNTAKETAVLEAFEEAGITGKILMPEAGSYRYKKWDRTCEVTVYWYRVSESHSDWPEKKFRNRQWLSFKRMVKIIDERIPRSQLDEWVIQLREMGDSNG